MLKALLACFLALLNRFISMVRVFCCRDIDVAYEPVANTPKHGDSHAPTLVGPGARKATHALVIPPSQDQLHSVMLQAPIPESGPSLHGSTASLPLLRSSLPSATDASANARVPSSDSQTFLPTQQQSLLIMRHGHREDEETPTWHVQAQRPWDPPLSALGRVQAKEAGLQLVASGTRVDYVVTSPFLRCLQTSAEIVRQLDLPAGKWLVNWAMCEIFDPRLLFAGRPEFQSKLVGQPTASWMWSGQSDKQYLAAFMADEAAASQVNIAPSMWCDTMPSLPEKMEAALHRYERAIKSMMVHFEGRNVLVVTHGEAVRAAVNMFQPAALVYEVKHTGHVQLSRSQVAGEWRSWELASASQATGVSWYA